MVALIVLAILVPVLFLILLITLLNRSSEQSRLLESMHDRVRELSRDVSSLSDELKEKKGTTSPLFTREKLASEIIPSVKKAREPSIEVEQVLPIEEKPAVEEKERTRPTRAEGTIYSLSTRIHYTKTYRS